MPTVKMRSLLDIKAERNPGNKTPPLLLKNLEKKSKIHAGSNQVNSGTENNPPITHLSQKDVLALTAQGRIMQGEGTSAGHTWLSALKIMRILLIHSSCALVHREISFPLTHL